MPKSYLVDVTHYNNISFFEYKFSTDHLSLMCLVLKYNKG